MSKKYLQKYEEWYFHNTQCYIKDDYIYCHIVQNVLLIISQL